MSSFRFNRKNMEVCRIYLAEFVKSKKNPFWYETPCTSACIHQIAEDAIVEILGHPDPEKDKKCKALFKVELYENEEISWRFWVGWKAFYDLDKPFVLKVRNGILLPKLFWLTVRKNCSSDREKLLKFKAEGPEFAKILKSLEQFIRTVESQKIFEGKNIF